MGVVNTLASLEKLVENSNKNFEDRPKTRYVSINDGKTVKIEFLQELDPNSGNYNAKAGQILIAVEHSNPENFRIKAECSADDEGACFGCEQYKVDPKVYGQWKAKARLYSWVLVDDGIEDSYVAILSQGVSNKSITPALIIAANDNKSVTNLSFRLKRNGKDFNNTSYTLMPIMNSEGAKVEDYVDKMVDLRTICTRQIPYAEQRAFYLGEAGEVQVVVSGSSSSTVEW